MLTHYFTLYIYVLELDKLFKNAVITDIFSQQKNELIIGLSDKTGVANWLCVSIAPTMNYIYYRESYARAKKNSVNLFASCINKQIKEVTLKQNDRIVSFALDNGVSIYFRLYNTSESNIFLVDGNEIVLESFKHGKELSGNSFRSGNKRFDEGVFQSREIFFDKFRQQTELSIFYRLRELIPVFGSLYSREIVHRSGIDENKQIIELEEKEIDAIYEKALEVRAEINKGFPSIYYNAGMPRVLSVIQLKHFSDQLARSFETMNQAIRFYISAYFSQKQFHDEKINISKKIKDLLERTVVSKSVIEKEAIAANRADDYDRAGHIIIANLQNMMKGIEKVELPDLYDNDKIVSIELDPRLSPAQNADRYFEKAKQTKLAKVEFESRTNATDKKIGLYQKMLLQLDQCSTIEQVEKFINEYREHLNNMRLPGHSSESHRSPFREFTVKGGYQVLAGKSSASNDLLTTKHAKPNDIWFHARGASGSHVVLKVPGSNSQLPKEAIMQAASIAAYYSKMRNADNVPVSYTERKYVRKSKGLASGKVHLEREEVLFVKPMLP